jgi:valyl-tRNA synthetase
LNRALPREPISAPFWMITMLDKTFDPEAVEPKISQAWEKAGAFRAGRPERLQAEPYTIVIPPPNVTGSLHMGHALNGTLQDALARYWRMKGRDVLWQPGTDHAGIATQMVVERKLAAEKRPGRREMGREAFLKEVWAWKEESGGTIGRQFRRLGASCDWSRERFTMDEGLSRAVSEFFVKLHEAGLIYRAKRLVNWDPKFQTAISDLEVEQREIKGNLWYFRYPVEGMADRFITVATTRPETMLGDTGIAVHPDDERFSDIVGKHAILPLVGRRIPIVADEYSDPEKGSGAVKITPAHDFNDFDVGKRAGLRTINILDAEARMLLAGNAEFLEGADDPDLASVMALSGKSREEARKAIIALMEARELVEKIEPHTHTVPHGDRSGVVIEPWLTDQWYVDVKPMAERSAEALRSGATRLVPPSFEKTYFDWMDNIEPWCVSRQLWWGHQIPAWYGPDGQVIVARNEAEARARADAKWGKGVTITRDEDVLDTWFSSALWPFSTLGWPDQDPMVKRHYPTSVLVTAYDIIFFWVARMMMAGLFTQDVVPFRDVLLHGLIRDAKGAKMSKSKGNVVDPLDVMDKYGSDALRFTLAISSVLGRDIKYSEKNVENYRNFGTKLWNASRFAEMNGCARRADFDPKAVESTVNRWILSSLEATMGEMSTAIEAYRFNEAAGAAYRFVWGSFCDWYVELSKPVLQGEDGAAKEEARATVAYVLDRILLLLHPFMPFITEELWAVLGETGPKRDSLLALSDWPEPVGLGDAAARAEIDWVIELITSVRSVRTEMNVAPGALVQLVLVNADDATRERALRHDATLKRLARLSDLNLVDAAPKGAARFVVGETTAALPLEGVIDLAAERARLGKERARLEDDLAKVEQKLGNPNFMARAAEDAIEEQNERKAVALARLAKVDEALTQLAS